jgi:uncharacterized membrane protein
MNPSSGKRKPSTQAGPPSEALAPVWVCCISGAPLTPATAIPLGSLHPHLLAAIGRQHPGVSPAGYVGAEALSAYQAWRISYLRVQKALAGRQRKSGTGPQPEPEVADAKMSTEPEPEAPPTFGQRLADRVAEFGGSWAFILYFFGVLLLWIAANAYLFQNKGFDPYPFILLNLILSCIAALQAPVIMMSQNRMEEKDRSRSIHDYEVNLRAELEIADLHQKFDHILLSQLRTLAEVQQAQQDTLARISAKLEAAAPTTPADA